VSIALYATIWVALAAFVAGEFGKRRRVVPAWAWRVSLAGALLCIVHILIAFGHRHHWSHDAAVQATARQTASVYGVAWGGGVYVNYVFVAAWLIELWQWRAQPAKYFARSPAARRAVRTFFFIIIVNAAVVFAAPSRRAAGVVMTAALLAIWAKAPAYDSRSTTAGSIRDAR
jgi:hypothetical protein